MIDGRGFDIHVSGGAGFMLQFVHNVIIHGLHMYDIVEGSGGMIRSKHDHVGIRAHMRIEMTTGVNPRTRMNIIKNLFFF
ncbi:putative pectate lyase [Helianthus annuus]|nr:putative pectate lyase [Helianthus annuus]